MIFGHDGKFGDLIAALSLVESMGGGDLVLRPTNPWKPDRWTEQSVKPILPLLTQQSYIGTVSFGKTLPREALDLGHWRGHYKHGLNLADNYCDWLGKPHRDRHLPWLAVEPDFRAKIVFARSARYHGMFPWARALRKYAGQIVYLGSLEEHASFVNRFGEVPYRQTSDLLEAARIIQAASLVCVNQTSLFWIAEALKRPLCLEACGEDWHRNCHYNRTGFFYGTSEWGELPDLDVLDELNAVLTDKVGEAIAKDGDSKSTSSPAA